MLSALQASKLLDARMILNEEEEDVVDLTPKHTDTTNLMTSPQAIEPKILNSFNEFGSGGGTIEEQETSYSKMLLQPANSNNWSS